MLADSQLLIYVADAVSPSIRYLWWQHGNFLYDVTFASSLSASCNLTIVSNFASPKYYLGIMPQEYRGDIIIPKCKKKITRVSAIIFYNFGTLDLILGPSPLLLLFVFIRLPVLFRFPKFHWNYDDLALKYSRKIKL